jgi:hypothetical protein
MGFKPTVGDLARVILSCSRFILLLVSLAIVTWQGCDVTTKYLAQPVSTEHQILPLSSMPNIRLSICKKFEITYCTFTNTTPCGSKELPAFFANASSLEDFWDQAENSPLQPTVRLRNWMDIIQFWNESQVRWETVFDESFSSKEEDILFSMQMYPYTENFTFLCHTLNRDVGALVPMLKLQRKGKETATAYFLCFFVLIVFLSISEGIADELYLFIHHAGQFLQLDTRNSLIDIDSPDGTTYLNLEILSSQSLSTPSSPCSENASTYDQCIQAQYFDILSQTNGCMLPFIEQQLGRHFNYCDSFESGVKSLESFQNSSLSCLTPCLLVFPDLTLQLQDQYLTNYLTKYILSNTGDRKGLYLLLPREMEVIESKLSYSLLSAVAHFLGVAGLFFGISVLGSISFVATLWTRMPHILGFDISKYIYLKRLFMLLLGLILASLVLGILVIFISKYVSFPSETNVSLDVGIPPMSLTFCHSKFMTVYSSETKSFHSITDDLGFWQNGSNVRNKITSFAVMNSAGEWSTIWNSSFPTILDDYIFSRNIFPLNNQTLQFCHSLSLQSYPGVTKVTY